MRGPPVSKKRRRQASAEDLEKRQLAAKAKRKKAAEKSRSASLAALQAPHDRPVKGAASQAKCFVICFCAQHRRPALQM